MGRCSRFRCSLVTHVECPITLWAGCSLGSDGCFATDCALRGTDAVVNPPGVQRLIPRWKADALRISNVSVQEAVFSTCRHPAKGLRICTWNTRRLLSSAASSQRPRQNWITSEELRKTVDTLCLQETRQDRAQKKHVPVSTRSQPRIEALQEQGKKELDSCTHGN